jgi:hypothetical protein
MSRAVAAVVLAFTAALAGLIALSGSPRVHAAWQGGGAFPGLGSGRIWKVAISPTAPATVLAATDKGVYRSLDGGQTWAQTALGTGRVWSVGFDLRAPHAILAALDGGGIQRSGDVGQTWSDASAGLPSRTVRSLAFGLDLVAAGTSNGVAVSSDGSAWQPAGLTRFDVAALAVSAYAPKPTLIAGVDNLPPGQSGYLFRNVGPTTQWEKLNVGPTAAAVASVAASALPAAPGVRVVIACTNAGVYRSNDGGTVWQKTYPASSDLTSTTLTTVSFSPIDPNLAYLGNDAGGSAGGALLRTTDAGLTFTPADAGLPPNREVTSIAVGSTVPPFVVAAINPPGGPAAVYVQSDSTAPAPAPTGPPEAAGALPSVTAPPSLAPTPTAPPPSPSTSGGGQGRLARLVNWPLPLAVELLTVLGALYVYMRWRQRRLHIEGPP